MYLTQEKTKSCFSHKSICADEGDKSSGLVFVHSWPFSNKDLVKKSDKEAAFKHLYRFLQKIFLYNLFLILCSRKNFVSFAGYLLVMVYQQNISKL